MGPAVERSGVRLYLGVPRSGKTTLAVAHASELARRLRRPLLVVEGEAASTFAAWPRARSVVELPELLWGTPGRAAILPDDGELGRLWNLCDRPGSLVVLVDGMHAFLSSAARARDRLVYFMRTHAHRRNWFLCTTHHLSGDVPQVALACAPELYLFRTAARSLDVLQRDFGIEPGALVRLGRGEYLHVRNGFSSA